MMCRFGDEERILYILPLILYLSTDTTINIQRGLIMIRTYIPKFGSILLLLLTGCSSPETTLSVNFNQNPSGGYSTTSVSAQFQGKLSVDGGTPLMPTEADPVDASVEWWWENSSGGGDQIVQSEYVTFSSEDYTIKSTNYAASPGYVLLNYYWVEIHWTDDSGNKHIQSTKAYCTN